MSGINMKSKFLNLNKSIHNYKIASYLTITYNLQPSTYNLQLY